MPIELDCAYMTMPPPDSDTLRASIHRAIRLNGGLSDNELYGLFPNRLQGTVRARRIELVRQGLVKDNGKDSNGRTIWVSV